jgi:3-oxoacyl-[acyl-carrier protein] reductase
MFSVKGKVSVVTGSGRGIGRAVALALGAEGSKLVINAKKGVQEVNETERELKEIGAESISVLADVGTREGCRNLIQKAMERFGSVDVLINNAGLGIYREFLELDDQIIDKVLRTSLNSAIYCSHEAAKVMNEGVIINMSSIAGILPFKGLSIYSVAKEGMLALTKAMARELAPRIRVNAVAPGVVRTKMGDSLISLLGVDEETFAKKYTLLGRVVTPEDVAQAVLFLVKMPTITGQTIVVDSGQLLVGS